VNRKLFSDHFLEHRLRDWPEFRAVDATTLVEDLADLWEREGPTIVGSNEARTEERFIKPILGRLGFSYTVQASLTTDGGHRQPDYALFLTEADRASADRRHGADRYRNAVAVCDAKRFGRPLDRRRVRGAVSEDPVAQILHYIAVTRRRWGVLTNGRLWRLYAAEGDLVEGACLEVDLCALLDARDVEAFRYFAALFSADAFVPGADGRALIDRALDGSRAQAVGVGEALRRQVFDAVPLLAQGVLATEQRTPDVLREAFDNALVLLYRLLFCLHAEDRGLIPVDNVHYRAYSLREQRRAIAEDIDAGRVFSSQSDDTFNDLRALFRIVDKGDPALGVNEYDGGLFSPSAHPWLIGRSVPDHLMARALDLLSRVDGEQVDYRDLSVRHLGTIFEQLLAFQLEDGEDGALRLVSAAGRKRTGAYFTPEYIVDDIVERTLGPLFDERSRRAAANRTSALDELLDLHVLDPAMGSGHFLVGAAAYLARRIANDPAYDGDLTLGELQGLVVERCIYGVDSNPMAVEVARLALWLSTVRDDRPLRFLGNLRAGNSLVGAELRSLLDEGADLFASELSDRARTMLDQVAGLVQIYARTGEEAHDKERIAAELDALRMPLLRDCDEAVDPPVSPAAGRPFHWEIEFPARFLDEQGRLRPGGGFDAVIGNPPYVRIQELGRDVATYCRSRYATAHGAFDAYVPFIERGLELLRRGGRLGFIVPNKFLKLGYADRLRGRLSRERAVESIHDFGDAQLFEGATNYTCVLVLDRAGVPELSFTAVKGTPDEVRRAVATRHLPRSERYATARLGSAPWLLVGHEERAIIDAMLGAGPSLGDVTRQIFQGLITSADHVYILEARGMHGGRSLLRDRTGAELELEPELLHPLASGSDAERFALRRLRSVLLFPYRRRADGQTRLMTEDELRRFPLTWSYLKRHEQTLRQRERGKMDRDGWWGYVYPKNLDAHDKPKLGVPRLCARLRAGADPNGAAYLDNVDVNGVLVDPAFASVWKLTPVLNSRIVDFAFRRGSVPFQNAFFSANKQFITWLPVPDASSDELERHGRRLHGLATAIEEERATFLDWLASICGTPLRELRGWKTVEAYPLQEPDAVLRVLDANAQRIGIDPRARSHRERILAELATSATSIREHQVEVDRLDLEVHRLLGDAYGLTSDQLVRIDSEYGA
jgi:type I restriction-modification system DNA methylase subunit